MPKLLTHARSNPKTAKLGAEFEACILHLAPARSSGVVNVCEFASKGCIRCCLNKAGRGAMHSVEAARIRKTREFAADWSAFVERLDHELTLLERRAWRKGLDPVARLNGTSDIPWELYPLANGTPSVIHHHPETQFYDYTKSFQRAFDSVELTAWPENYHLTLSRTEEWAEGETRAVCDRGVSVAVVFERIPESFEGVRVIDGTKHDWRFRDPSGVVVGLLPMGPAKRDRSGFVVRNAV